MMGIEGTKIIGDEGLDADKLQGWLDSIAAWANGNVGLQSLVNRYTKSAIGFTLCADDDDPDAGAVPLNAGGTTYVANFYTKLPLVDGVVILRNLLFTARAKIDGGNLTFRLYRYPDETFTDIDKILMATQTLTNPGGAGFVSDYDERTFFPEDYRFLGYEVEVGGTDPGVWDQITWCAETTWQLQEF